MPSTVQPQQTERLATVEEVLERLLQQCEKGSLSIEMLTHTLSGRGRLLFLIFLCLPFGQLFGMGVPFGLMLTFLGLRLGFGSSHIRLPEWLARRQINATLLKKMTQQILYVVKKLKRFSYARYEGALSNEFMKQVNGSTIALVGFCLAIQPLIPFTSYIGSFAIFLLGMGILNNDGMFIWIGRLSAIFYGAVVAFELKYFSLKAALTWVWSLFS